MRLSLILVALSCTLSNGESCEGDVVGDAHKVQGLLQVTRARESLTVGNNNGDTASLLAMKTQLKSKLDLGEKLDNDETIFFSDFMEFLRNTSLKNINLTHEGDQQEIDDALAEVVACNSALLGSQTTGQWSTTLTSQNTSEGSHKTCRDEEVVKWQAPNTTCAGTLDGFVNSFSASHAALPAFPGWNAWGTVQNQPLVNWLDDFHELHCAQNARSTFVSHAETCEEDAIEAKNHRIWCKHNQTQFEQHVCSHRDVVKLDCDTLDGCYANESARFQTTVDANVAENEYLKVEYTIIKTIICYIELLIGDASQITDENKRACEGPYDTDFLNLVIPALVAKDSCELVTRVPCTADFLQHYYGGLPPNAPANLCVVCV